jgi:hypothetical protein
MEFLEFLTCQSLKKYEMNYGDFRVNLKSLSADKNALSFEGLAPIVHHSLIQVALKTDPLVLITNDKEKKILQNLEDGLFVREPNLPVDESSIIDIDSTLIYAVLYITASKLAHNDNILKYKKEAELIINNYNWERYRVLNDGKEIDLLSISKKALDLHGYKKIYIEKVKTLNGYFYEWDEAFIKNLDIYLVGAANKNLSISDVDNMKLFIAYAENTMTSEHEEFLTITALDKHLGSYNG